MSAGRRSDAREQLQLLLGESVSATKERERSEFDRRAGSLSNLIVLFGARKLGRKTLAGLREAGIEPVAFSDNGRELWGTAVDGVPVYSPEDAAKKFGSSAIFVITIWGYGSSDSMRERTGKLMELGCRAVIPFIPLFWKYAEHLLPHNALDLPHKVQEQGAAVARAFEVLSDERSQIEFLRQLRWRLTGDFDALGDPVSDEIYFPREILAAREPEVFVDCGAFDGDTILRFLAQRHGRFERIIAFEPDPHNLAALERTLDALPGDARERTRILPLVVGSEPGTVRFSATGTLGAAIGDGDLEVECVRLDDVLADEAPSYIKMDIEAAEPDALRGGRSVIRKNSPVIAACSYHVQSHMWEIPLLMAELQPEYAIFLRQHIQLVEDLVSYAVPQDRLGSAV